MGKKILILILFIAIIGASAIEKEVCEKISSFITLNNWKFNETELEKLDNETGINNSIDYINNFSVECSEKYDLTPLPKKPDIPTIYVFLNQTNCSIELGSFWEASIPWWDWDGFFLGDLECNNVQSLKYFFKIEEGYSVKGLRIWIIFLIALIWIGWQLFRENRMLNRIARRS